MVKNEIGECSLGCALVSDRRKGGYGTTYAYSLLVWSIRTEVLVWSVGRSGRHNMFNLRNERKEK